MMSTNALAKHAAKILKKFKLNVSEFPELHERLQKNAMRYYLGQYLYSKPGMPSIVEQTVS